ncbi:hypothetical protein L3N51_00092 [Metallosphaera sp. J1]|nr:hypothetical protein [Metallosphaera javensis (ex Hofmann et al. 2022)]
MRELFLLLLALSSAILQQNTFVYYFQSPNQILVVNVTSEPLNYVKPYNLSNGILLVLNFTPQNITSNISFSRVNSTALIVPLYELVPNSTYQINFALSTHNVTVHLSSALKSDSYRIPTSSNHSSSSSQNLQYVPFVVFVSIMVIISILLNRSKRH